MRTTGKRAGQMAETQQESRSKRQVSRPGADDQPNSTSPGVEGSSTVRDVVAASVDSSTLNTLTNDEVRQAIGFLRGEDNPFDVFVAAQSADESFFGFHTPEVHAEAQEKIRRAIDKYAKPDYRTRHDLYPTRALLVRGARGAGKTHLLHAVQFRDDGAHDLLVRPRYFEKQYPFAEYVLKEIVRTLLGGDETEPPSPLRWAADRVARRLLREALLGMSPQDWLERTEQPSGMTILFGRRRRTQMARRYELTDELALETNELPLMALCRRHGLEPDVSRLIVAEHVDASDPGTRSLVRMRRRLLMAFYESHLADSLDPLTSFLETGFADASDGLGATRAALVDDLLRTLVEVLAAAGVPVVVAFDNIERLLAPLGRLDAAIAQSFFSGIAQLIDGVSGIFLLLFVEDGLWIECTQQAIDSFARDRLLLGIRMRDYGHVAEIPLGAPSSQAIEAIVRRRMAPLRVRLDPSDRLPGLFPFGGSDVRAIAGHSSDVLRAALLRLRDRYDEIVLNGPASPPGVGQSNDSTVRVSLPSSTRSVPSERLSQVQVDREILQPRWDAAIGRALRRVETTPRGSLAGELHAGLGRWLDTFVDVAGTSAPIHTRGSAFRLFRVESGVAFGDHPSFGLLTVAHWQTGGGDIRRVGAGLVLAMGSGMPRDLAIKLSVFRNRPTLVDELVVMWPDRDSSFQLADMPVGSRKVWEEEAVQLPVHLCGLSGAELCWILAFIDWSDEIAESARPGWPDHAVREFVRARTAALLERLAPNC